jgi:hypothetical protein
MKLPPIVIGGLAGLAVALLLAPATGTALGNLTAARAGHAKLAELAARPAAAPPLLAPGLGLRAADPAGARAAILLRVRGLAQSGGVLVEEASIAPAPDGVVALRIRLSGPEKAVIALTDALERGKPLMRLRTWRIEPLTESEGVRLIGEVVAAWQ